MTKAIKHPAIKYAESVVKEKVRAPKYVKLQCQNFLNDAYGKSEILYK